MMRRIAVTGGYFLQPGEICQLRFNKVNDEFRTNKQAEHSHERVELRSRSAIAFRPFIEQKRLDLIGPALVHISAKRAILSQDQITKE